MGDFEVHRLVVRAEDDLPSILNSISTDTLNNTEVILREGTHTLDAQVTWTNISKIVVRGPKSAILNVTYAADSPFILTAPLTDIEFNGFTIQTPATGGHDFFDFQGTGGVTFTRMRFKNLNYIDDYGNQFIRNRTAGQEDTNLTGLEISGCEFSGTALTTMFRTLVQTTRTWEDIRIIGNSWQRAAADGAPVFGIFGAGTTKNMIIAKNTVINGFEFMSTSGSIAEDIIIEGNILEGFTKGGNQETMIFNGTMTGIQIRGNTFRNLDARFAISLGGANNTNAVVSNNTISDNVQVGGDGIRVGCSNSTISGNNIKDCDGDGLYITGDNNKIANNTSDDSTSGYGFNEDATADGNHYVGNRASGNSLGDKSLSGTGRRQGVNFW